MFHFAWQVTRWVWVKITHELSIDYYCVPDEASNWIKRFTVFTPLIYAFVYTQHKHYQLIIRIVNTVLVYSTTVCRSRLKCCCVKLGIDGSQSVIEPATCNGILKCRKLFKQRNTGSQWKIRKISGIPELDRKNLEIPEMKQWFGIAVTVTNLQQRFAANVKLHAMHIRSVLARGLDSSC